MGNDELARSGFEAFLRGDWDALAEIMDPDVGHASWRSGSDRAITPRELLDAPIVDSLDEVVANGYSTTTTAPAPPADQRMRLDQSFGLTGEVDEPQKC